MSACKACGMVHDTSHWTAPIGDFGKQWSTTGVSVIRGDAFIVTADWPAHQIDLIVTDPPYGNVVDECWDAEWSTEHYTRLGTTIERLLKPGGTAYVWGGIGSYRNRDFFSWLARVEDRTRLKLHDVITWRKRRAYGKLHSYLFTREECAMLISPPGRVDGASGLKANASRDLRPIDWKPSTFHIPLLVEKRGYKGYNPDYPAKSDYLRRTNVWDDVTELFSGKIHPCEKPSRLAEIMIETSSNPGEIVLDLFAGSGSTGVAAHKLNRRCILIEASNCEMRPLPGNVK